MLTTYAVSGRHALVQAVSFACDVLPSTLLAKWRHPFFTMLLKHHLPCQDCPNPSHDPVKHRWVLSISEIPHFRMLPESICNVLLKHESPWRASHYWRQQHRMVMPRDTSSRLNFLVDKSEISILWIAGRVAEIGDPGEMLSRCPQVVLSIYC